MTRDESESGMRAAAAAPGVYGPSAPPRSSPSQTQRRLREEIDIEAAPPEESTQPPSAYSGIPTEIECGPTPTAKRAIDIVGGSMMIGVLWPVFALAAALIKLDSPGPVFVRQKRIGLNGAEFRFLKFRTMHHVKKQSDILDRLPLGDLTRRLLSPRGRPRNATAVGWALRKTTVDELPQLLNVVKGDMSLVGPRPDMPQIVGAWPEEFRQRHMVSPGMTGLAQINGRSDITHYEKVRYDMAYVRHHPISRDLRILLKTVTLVISKKGAR
jgi:lipopolysaccharide/colanic/teichoic acid biosynthesis glycosyltransferase